MQTQDYIVDDDGNFRFTNTGLDNQAPLLAKAGIDARLIKTHREYLQARQAASPYFLEYLREEMDKRLDGKPDTLEWQAIRSIVFGSPDEQDKVLEKVRLKQSMRII